MLASFIAYRFNAFAMPPKEPLANETETTQTRAQIPKKKPALLLFLPDDAWLVMLSECPWHLFITLTLKADKDPHPETLDKSFEYLLRKLKKDSL